MFRPSIGGAACAVLLAFTFAGNAPAQETDPASRLKSLEERLQKLEQENAALRGELEALKHDLGGAATTSPAVAEDLTAITLAPPAPATAAPAASEPPPVQLVDNPPPAAGKVFNPDISVIGNFLGRAGDENPFEERPTLGMEESEIAFQAFVDPYAQAKFYIAVSDEGAELEEGFVNFIALPKDFTARAGKLKAAFGKENLMHTHVRPWVDQPLVISNFFGDEGFRGSGISVSRIFPNRSKLFVEGTAEVYDGTVDGMFEADGRSDLAWVGHLKAYRDLTEQSNLELGASYAQGSLEETGGTNRYTGLDLTYRFKPLQRAIYRSLISRTEVIRNEREGSDDAAVGFYTSLDYQFARRWFAGIRLDRSERVDDPAVEDRGGSLVLTFWPSEFSQLRAQARRTRYASGPWVNELLLQIQFAIGAHGAHTF
jgi:hypothetical protein